MTSSFIASNPPPPTIVDAALTELLEQREPPCPRHIHTLPGLFISSLNMVENSSAPFTPSSVEKTPYEKTHNSLKANPVTQPSHKSYLHPTDAFSLFRLSQIELPRLIIKTEGRFFSERQWSSSVFFYFSSAFSSPSSFRLFAEM